MAKAPQLGKAKTRLAADIGKIHALRHYRSMLSRVIRQVQDPRWETVVAVTPAHMLGRVSEFDGLLQMAQVDGSLSPKLAQVFTHKGPTLVIGTDCPQVQETDIADGFKALRTYDAVFGPARDGGFWLMGYCGPAPRDMFAGVRWSHEETLADMAARIDGDVHYLRTLTDVDDLASLKRVYAET